MDASTEDLSTCNRFNGLKTRFVWGWIISISSLIRYFFVAAFRQQFILGNQKNSRGKMGRNTRATTSASLVDTYKSTQDYVNITRNSQNELCISPSNPYVSGHIGENDFKSQCRFPVGTIVSLLDETEDFFAAKLLNTQALKLKFSIWDTIQKTTKSSIPSLFGLIIVLKQKCPNYTTQSQKI